MLLYYTLVGLNEERFKKMCNDKVNEYLYECQLNSLKEGVAFLYSSTKTSCVCVFLLFDDHGYFFCFFVAADEYPLDFFPPFVNSQFILRGQES